MLDLFDIKNKVAVITGASSGLGADAARAFADAGAKVALLARRQDKLEALCSELQENGADALVVKCDVTDLNSCKEAVDKVLDNYQTIDILINDAGVAVRGGVDSIDEESWDFAFDVNVKGIYHMCKYVVPIMKHKEYGKIINVASVNAVIADKSDLFIRHSYNSSKAAVVGLTRGMAASYAQYNITVNAVGPALFESEMTADTLFKSEKFLGAYNMLNPSSRPGRKGELNGTLIYLASDASSYVQGQFILVDGGGAIV